MAVAYAFYLSMLCIIRGTYGKKSLEVHFINMNEDLRFFLCKMNPVKSSWKKNDEWRRIYGGRILKETVESLEVFVNLWKSRTCVAYLREKDFKDVTPERINSPAAPPTQRGSHCQNIPRQWSDPVHFAPKSVNLGLFQCIMVFQ